MSRERSWKTPKTRPGVSPGCPFGEGSRWGLFRKVPKKGLIFWGPRRGLEAWRGPGGSWSVLGGPGASWTRSGRGTWGTCEILSGDPKTSQNHDFGGPRPILGTPSSRITIHFWTPSGSQAWGPPKSGFWPFFEGFWPFLGVPGTSTQDRSWRGFWGVLERSWGVLETVWRRSGSGPGGKSSSARSARVVARLQTQTFGDMISPGERRGVFRAGGVPHERRAWPL